jgi:tetratricopeptide (TPR) repeat protein
VGKDLLSLAGVCRDRPVVAHSHESAAEAGCRGGVAVDDRIARAHRLHHRMVFAGDSHGLAAATSELDGVEADLCLARGKLLNARFAETGVADPEELPTFERAARFYRASGDLRGEAQALCWIGIVLQVVRRDDGAAVGVLERARALATAAADPMTVSYALRHLGIAAHAAGRLDIARAHLEESTRLRHEAGFPAGVAANLVGLIYIAAAQGRPAEALVLADQARDTAEAAGAHRILHQIAEARASLHPDW